jgi:3-oxoadipate enol-lactonase
VADQRVNGVDLYFEHVGTGPRLLFLNGSGATLEVVGPLISMFASRFEVLAHDQRGLGKSGMPDGPYSMADYALDAAALAESIGWDRYRVVGLSFGGMVAQELAVTVPERIERLALLCTSSGGDGGDSYPLHTLGALSPAEQGETWQRIIDTRFTAEWLAEHDADRMLAAILSQRAIAEKTDVVRRGEELQLAARSGHDVYDRLPRIECPTLVAAGRYDGIAPLENCAAIVEQLPRGVLQVYEGGHTFFSQDPRALPDVLAFLSQ